MHRDSGDATVGVTELLVRSTLPHLDEPEAFETRYHFAWPQNGQGTHSAFLRDADRFGADELCFARRLAILKEHGDDLL